MSPKRLLLVVLLTLGGAAAADDPKEDPSKADLKAMQGDWACVSMTRDGATAADDDAQSLFRTVKDDQYSVFLFRKEIGKGTFAIDASKKPRTIDSVPANGATAGKRLLGIYEWTDADTIKTCYASPDKERPTDFSCKQGSERTLTVWRREKK
jgi:uncharacterized protein (TIGR03067 family)